MKRGQLAEVCLTITKGTTPTTLGMNYSDSGVPFIRVNNFPTGVLRLNDDILFVSEATHRMLSRSVIRPRDVLLSIAGTIGRSCVVPPESPEANCNQAVCIIRTDESVLDSSYLNRWLSSDDACIQLSGGKVTGVISNLSLTNVRNLQIPLPPLAEQKRIAAILDAADALRAKRREALAQLDSLLQSTFIDMFGDPVTNPMGWEKQRMGELMRIRRGGSPRPIEKYLGGTINWIKIGDATRSGDDLYITSCAEKITEAGLSKTTLLAPGSFVFANSGVSLGFARILKVSGAIHDGWLAFEDYDRGRLNEVFLLKTLNGITDHFRRIAPSGTQPNLNTRIMNSFELILPPITDQHRFATIVESVERQKTRMRTHLAELDALFAALQHRAFKGDL